MAFSEWRKVNSWVLQLLYWKSLKSLHCFILSSALFYSIWCLFFATLCCISPVSSQIHLYGVVTSSEALCFGVYSNKGISSASSRLLSSFSSDTECAACHSGTYFSSAATARIFSLPFFPVHVSVLILPSPLQFLCGVFFCG